VIDTASEQGGGVIMIPEGTFMSGALFFKQGTSLWLVEEPD
jgi:polygalacturonase